PQLGDEEKKAVCKVIDSGLIAQGPKVGEFEENFADYVGTKYAVATTSGTTALHTALLAQDIGIGDEVLTTAFTFIASANTILYTGAKPVFCDIGEDYNIDAEKIKAKITGKTKAIMPIHLYGQPAGMDEIKETAQKHNLKVIEDACQAHGAEINNKKVGSIGDAGCFSFYPTKNMTCSEGGMITTNKKEIAEKARLLRAHGSPKRYHHKILGYNYRMTDIHAAIGLTQLKKLDESNKKRRANAQTLTKQLTNIQGIETPRKYEGRTPVYHQYTIRLRDFPLTRENVIKRLRKQGISSAIYYPLPVHKQELYLKRGYTDSLPITEKYANQVLSLPIHPSLTEDELTHIADAFKKMAND
ncbi:MAG: aminotransferase class V-fold PLP-dependent enzyme, partial [Candidatus Altiarchaeales archaeon]|nr:aminotransferase class V-fold PLP-dependent enzyme [Candidatus Altiarchaeales archaeon]